MENILAPQSSVGAAIAQSLVFENVTYDYGATRALDSFSLTLPRGKVMCLLGPSGCGKSTALRLAAGLERVQSGKILIDGMLMGGPSHHVPPERRGLGMVFQDFALFPHMTLLDNVAYGLTSLDRKTAHATARRALSRVGLEDRADDYPHMLSGGQQQRVALARTIVPRPGIVLLDEPFSGLDSRLRDRVRQETLQILSEAGVTVLMVTHDAQEALICGDRIALVSNGRVVQDGTPNEIFNAPRTLEVAEFFSPNLRWDAVVMNGHVDTPIARLPADNFAEGENVVVAVRQSGFAIQAAQNSAGRAVFVRSLRQVGIDLFAEVIFEGADIATWISVDPDTNIAVGEQIYVEPLTDQTYLFKNEMLD
jgi:iron(III) transport system ATP-binding protein